MKNIHAVFFLTKIEKIHTTSHVPVELRQAWLQHLRDFDTAHPGCHFEVLIDTPSTVTVGEMIETLRVEPELSVVEIIERKKNRHDGQGNQRDDS